MKTIQFTILGVLIILGTVVQGQQFFSQPNAQSKWFGGGYLGLGFSNDATNIEVSPLVGYRVQPFWDVGIRLTYQYFSYRVSGVSGRATSNNYGASLFTRLFIIEGLFAHAEVESINYQVYGINLNAEFEKLDREWLNSIFIGGGYRQWLGGRTFTTITILYNLNETIDSPYPNPIFRIGFGTGF